MAEKPPPPSSKTQVKFPWATLAVAILLGLYMVMALGASLQKGPSFDEEQQLAIGYNIWTHGGFRMENADGDLIKRWATLPYLISQPHEVADDSTYRINAKPYRFGFAFFFQNGNPPEWLLIQGRLMAAILGAMTGLLVYFCAKKPFGTLGGIFSLIVFVFNPHMLAFGGTVSTEMSLCFTLLGATWAVWRLLHRVTWRRLAVGLLFTSLLTLAKPSALVIFPITFVLIIIKLLSQKPLDWQLGPPRVVRKPLTQLGLFAGLLLAHCLVAWIALWAHYDFRFTASANPDDPTLIMTHYKVTDPVDPKVASIMDWVQDKHLLPEGFLHGIQILLGSNERRQAFMDGRWTIGGWRTFFPYAFWEKTSPFLLTLLVVGVTGWGFLRRLDKVERRAGHASKAVPTPPSLYQGVPYFVLVGVYFLVAMMQEVNIGHRHILPIYPALIILGAGPLALIWGRAKPVVKVLVVFLLGSIALESLLLAPDYLAYFSPLVGGPAKGHEHLVDSSLDWGMDLPGLEKWLAKNNPGNREQVYLAYFGIDSPDYHGIKAERLPSYPDWRPYETFGLGPGIYAISATLFESVYSASFGPWNTEYEQHYQSTLHNILTFDRARQDPYRMDALLEEHPQEFWNTEYDWFEKLRFARLCAWLRHHRPVPNADIGYSILIWRLSPQDLEQALLGPPAEIDDSPLG